MTDHINKMASDVFTAVSGFVQKAMAPLAERLSQLEKRFSELPAPRDGVDGTNGKDADVDYERVIKAVAEQIPAPKDGKDGNNGVDGAPGKDAEVDYDRVIESVKSLLPVPKDGKDGKDGRDGIDGKDGANGLPGEKGMDGGGGPQGNAGADGARGEDGREGEPGRDALTIEVLDTVDPERKYQRGTFASFRGGLIRAFRATDPIGDGEIEKAGWSVVVHGVDEIAIEQGDDLRTFAVGIKTTSGQTTVKKFSMPVVIDRGVFELGSDYQRGDASSWDGSIWIAQERIEKADQRPAPPLWRLSVKRGRDGRDLRPDGPVPPREPLRLR